MAVRRTRIAAAILIAAAVLSACGGSRGGRPTPYVEGTDSLTASTSLPYENTSRPRRPTSDPVQENPGDAQLTAVTSAPRDGRRSSLLDLFTSQDDPNVTVEVNKYLWNAALDVLNFLPIEAADPFSGLIVTGYGAPPGGGRPYRATIYIRDPALDARSLKLSLQTSGGPASPDTVRAVEDAILTRARQLRIRDGKL